MSTLAHYGGIDEIGVFVVPVIVTLLAIRWAERRARAKASTEPVEGDE